MANWIVPAFSASRVKAAGKRIRDQEETAEDLLVMENWRASHAYVLNTFQTNLRRRAKDKTVTVAQRLKRRPTIFSKLIREPTMQLNTMHDIAGCRLIFSNQNDLLKFRASLQASRSQHQLKYDGQDRYNYIKRPKRSGYRGIHDVYEYKVSTPFGAQWNGLHIEVQFRTVYQHAWATAVEAADFVTSSKIKFSLAEQRYERFFQICSELIARAFERQTSCLAFLTNSEVLDELRNLEHSTGLLAMLRALKRSSSQNVFKANTLLIAHIGDGAKSKPLEIETYDNLTRAIERYSALEKELGRSADVVLVRAQSAEDVRDAFRNYFADTHDFVSYIDQGRGILMSIPEMRVQEDESTPKLTPAE